VHKDVRVLGEPARIERAVVRLLELARLALAPVFWSRVWAWAWNSVQWRTKNDDSVGPIEKERAKGAPAVGSARRSGEVVERERKVEHRGKRAKCEERSEVGFRDHQVAGCQDVHLERVLSRSSPSRASRESTLAPRSRCCSDAPALEHRRDESSDDPAHSSQLPP
jgi:hypothetical protein